MAKFYLEMRCREAGPDGEWSLLGTAYDQQSDADGTCWLLSQSIYSNEYRVVEKTDAEVALIASSQQGMLIRYSMMAGF